VGAAAYLATVSLIVAPLASTVPAARACLSTVVAFRADFLRLIVTAQLAFLAALRAFLSLRPLSFGTTQRAGSTTGAGFGATVAGGRFVAGSARRVSATVSDSAFVPDGMTGWPTTARSRSGVMNGAPQLSSSANVVSANVAAVPARPSATEDGGCGLGVSPSWQYSALLPPAPLKSRRRSPCAVAVPAIAPVAGSTVPSIGERSTFPDAVQVPGVSVNVCAGIGMCVAGARNATGAALPAGIVKLNPSPAGTARSRRSPSPMLSVPPVIYPAPGPAGRPPPLAALVDVENAAAASTAISVVRETDALMNRRYAEMSEMRHDQRLGS
jgi:hypothetical protein